MKTANESRNVRNDVKISQVSTKQVRMLAQHRYNINSQKFALCAKNDHSIRMACKVKITTGIPDIIKHAVPRDDTANLPATTVDHRRSHTHFHTDQQPLRTNRNIQLRLMSAKTLNYERPATRMFPKTLNYNLVA